MELIFGTKIWENEFVYNKFPYLSEDYMAMTDSDKKAVEKMFY